MFFSFHTLHLGSCFLSSLGARRAESSRFDGLTSLLGVEGDQLGAGFDVVPLAGERAGSDIVDPTLDLKTQREHGEGLKLGDRHDNREVIIRRTPFKLKCFVRPHFSVTRILRP